MKPVDLIKAKAHLLCYGIRRSQVSDEFYCQQNPQDIKKGGYVGIHFLLGKKIPVLASVTNEFTRGSKFEIERRGDQFYLVSNQGEESVPIDPIIMPGWLSGKTSSGKLMSQVFAHEGLHYLHQLYKGCEFQGRGLGCKFCGTGQSDNLNTLPRDIAETALAAYKENPEYQVCLGGGGSLSASRRAEFFVEGVKLIREKNNTIPIWIEMIPPDSDQDIRRLIDAGASGFGFNLEIWDDQLRKQICSGKSAVAKDRYFAAWKFVRQNLGENRVNTVLIQGLESKESTLAGIHEISKAKVRITLLPFKPWDASELKNRKPADPNELFELATLLAGDMAKHGIDPEQSYGCANCASCTIEEDILKYLISK